MSPELVVGFFMGTGVAPPTVASCPLTTCLLSAPSTLGSAALEVLPRPAGAALHFNKVPAKLCYRHAEMKTGHRGGGGAAEGARLLCPWDFPGKNTGMKLLLSHFSRV